MFRTTHTCPARIRSRQLGAGVGCMLLLFCTSVIWATQLRSCQCKLHRYNRNILRCCSLGRFKDNQDAAPNCMQNCSWMCSAKIEASSRPRGHFQAQMVVFISKSRPNMLLAAFHNCCFKTLFLTKHRTAISQPALHKLSFAIFLTILMEF